MLLILCMRNIVYPEHVVKCKCRREIIGESNELYRVFLLAKAHPGRLKQKVTNIGNKCLQKKKNSSAKKIVETRGFLQSWLLEFDWLRFNSVSNSIFCDFCQRAGRQMAGNTDFVSGSTKTTTTNNNNLLLILT